MAGKILTKSVVGDLVIEDVLCDVDSDLEMNEAALASLVQILRPAVNHVAGLCDDPNRLHEVIGEHSRLLMQTSSVASAAFDIFASNVIAAI